MPKRQVFYSFHYANDVMRVQQIRNIGVLEGNQPVSANQWETLRRQGDAAIKKWIRDTMASRSCVIVLIGKQTAHRPYVQYEIKQAWKQGKGLFGIHIHNMKCPNNGTCTQGPNPFSQFNIEGTPFNNFVSTYIPPANNAYGHIAANIDTWIETAIAQRK